MGWVKRLALLGAGGVGLLAAAGAGGYAWAARQRDAVFARPFDAHRVDFPVPWPLTEAEIEALRAERRAAVPADPAAPAADPAAPPPDPLAGVDLTEIARARSAERGKHLVESRYVCIECHGADFGGGTMIDDPAMGTILGSNLTLGKGGVTADYTPADWDRKVRHGVDPRGHGGIMPSEDFVLMSDQELADIVTYIRSVPPVDKVVPPHVFGPIGTVLVATGTLPLSAERIGDRPDPHRLLPPTDQDPDFGRHLLNVCSGCHRQNFEGGPIPGGPPDWAPSANLTPHADGLAGWTYEQFVAVLQQGVRPNGQPVVMPMSMVTKYGARLTEPELRAMWGALQALPPVPDGA